jgi:aldehyde:ferredoxin oxidoreductase
MECYEKGIISKEDTGRIELNFGRSDLLVKLIRDNAYRQDFEEFMSLGTKVMAEKLGKGSYQFAMYYEGLELGGCDPIGAKIMALVYVCGSRGGCHITNGLKALADEKLPEEERLSDKLNGLIVKRARDRKVIVDSVIMCQFVVLGVSNSTLARLINGAIGYDFSVDDLYIIAEWGSNVE